MNLSFNAVGLPFPENSSDGTAPFEEAHPAADVSHPKLRVLLAENNVLFQKIYSSQLKKRNCVVDTAANGLEVLAALLRTNYDVVLMDCHMPEMDGYEATSIIRNREQNTSRPPSWKVPLRIVALAAGIMPGDREECRAAGMDDCISKPARPADLEAVLARCVDQSADNG